MKAAILIMTILLSAQLSAKEGDINDYCLVFSELASDIMKARQHGAPLSMFIKRKKTTRTLALLAYDRPLFSSAKYKKIEIMKFENKALMECLRAEGK